MTTSPGAARALRQREAAVRAAGHPGVKRASAHQRGLAKLAEARERQMREAREGEWLETLLLEPYSGALV
jgi:hypothetical protein